MFTETTPEKESATILFLNTLQYLDSIIFSSSPDGKRYYFISQAIEKIIGITPDYAISHLTFVMRLIFREDFSEFKYLCQQAKSGFPSTVEYRIKNISGNTIYLRHSAFPVIENDIIIRVDGIIHDITKEKLNEERLRKSEERLRNIVETADDFIFTLDESGNFSTVNNNGALNLEYLPQEMSGRHFFEFITGDKKAEIARKFQEILRNHHVVTFEASFQSKYNKTLIFEISARALYENGRLAGVIGIGRNISNRLLDQEKMKDLNNKLIEANRIISIERDRAKQKISILEELNRLKNEFVSNISHELRTPLASIIGFAETIDSDSEMPTELHREFNQIILSEAKRLAKLINDVLDISKIEEGKINLAKTEFDINTVLLPLINQFKNKIEEKGIVFWHDIPKQSVTVFGDRDRIVQVFENLLNNAIKFTNEGRITLLAQSLYREYEVLLTDTGIGIPKKDIPFLFQKFYRVSRPGSEIPGTGLGLAFVKQIIDLHKGYIGIRSEENKGTTIVVKLPIVKKE